MYSKKNVNTEITFDSATRLRLSRFSGLPLSEQNRNPSFLQPATARNSRIMSSIFRLVFPEFDPELVCVDRTQRRLFQVRVVKFKVFCLFTFAVVHITNSPFWLRWNWFPFWKALKNSNSFIGHILYIFVEKLLCEKKKWFAWLSLTKKKRLYVHIFGHWQLLQSFFHLQSFQHDCAKMSW